MGDLLTQQQISRTEATGISRYYELTKPRIVSLLVFTSLTATYVAQQSLKYPFSILEWLIAGVAITAGSAGCNVLTCYIDRDIDAIMHRTRHRPIPSGRITPKNALRFGLLLVAISLLLALTFNILSFTWMALGIVDNVIVYSLVLKRRSPLNILLGGFSGGLPVLFGWSAVTPGPIGSFSLVSTLMAGLVFLWIPIHIWFLAVSSKADYARANIPMLPAVVGTVTALRLITLFSLVFIPFSLAVYYLGNFGLVYGLTAGIGSVLFSLAVFMSWPDRPKKTLGEYSRSRVRTFSCYFWE